MFRKPAAPAVSEHAKLRSRQLSEFLKLNPTAQCVTNGLGQADTTATYTLQLATHTAGLLTLTILLGPLFPERPPVCQLTTQTSQLRLHHKYLDANGYLSMHPKLQQAHWSPHQNLGLLVQDLVRELIAQPPQLVAAGQQPAFSAATQSPLTEQKQQQHAQQQAASNMQQVPPAYQGGLAAQPPAQPNANHSYLPQSAASSSSSSSASLTPPIIPPRRPSIPSASNPASVSGQRTRPPEVPTSFPQLDGLSIAQLEALLAGTPEEQAQAVKDLAAETPEVQQLEEVQRQLCTRIDELAKANLSKRAELETLAAKASLEATRLREHQQTFQALLQRQHATAQKYALPSVMAQLDAAITALEDQSEETKEKYEAQPKGAAEQDQSVLEQYIKERMVVHERSAKRERIQEMYGRQ